MTGSEDEETFARAMGDVTPLKRDSRGRFRAPARTSIAGVRAAAGAASTPATEAEDETHDSFAADGVDRRELRKMRRGAYPVADRLDLHGRTVAEAGERTRRFIDASCHRRYRCVCIVHGHGVHSEGGVSKLKPHVRACLRSHRAVLAYADAPSGDGGPGAVYVLLRG